MGACEFSSFGTGENVKDVFAKLIDQALYDHGHSGYSGSIAEKSEYEVRGNAPMTMSKAQAFISKDLDNNKKWGPAFAVRVIDVEKDGKPVSGYWFYGYASC